MRLFRRRRAGSRRESAIKPCQATCQDTSSPYRKSSRRERPLRHLTFCYLLWARSRVLSAIGRGLASDSMRDCPIRQHGRRIAAARRALHPEPISQSHPRRAVRAFAELEPSAIAAVLWRNFLDVFQIRNLIVVKAHVSLLSPWGRQARAALRRSRA